jgi:hypothetical protein
VTPGWQVALAAPALDLGLGPAAEEKLSLAGSLDPLPGALGVLDCAVASASAALLAADRLNVLRSGSAAGSLPAGNFPAIEVELDADHVAASFWSEALVTVGGRSVGAGFAPLSRFWPTAGGFLRTHANYPWHHAALLRALDVSDDADVPGALALLSAAEAESRIIAAGGVAAAVRTRADWSASAPGRAAGVRPLIDIEAVGDAPPRTFTPFEAAGRRLPASGLRVLDLTRVIAGPVATRTLAALGADVLRIDPPDRPELESQRVDSLLGKRSALLDADTASGRRILDELVEGSDVVVCGYRPASLDRLGLHPQALAYRHPGVVFASVSAWGTTGPWSTRRGFDSLVQAAVGIALAESPDGTTPGALPCQLLDHASGYLLAAGILEAVSRQAVDGGTLGVWVSLARTADWLLTQPRPVVGESMPAARTRDPAQWLVDLPGDVRVVAPLGRLDGVDLQWPDDRGSYGADEPRW